MQKKKVKIKINNHIKAYGQTDTKTNLVEINVKKHKGDKKQLADTVKHEIYHTKHPKATEKTVYKMTGKLPNMTKEEETKWLAKLRAKKINYKGGVMKRKLHLKGETKAGDMITKMNEIKRSKNITSYNKPLSIERLAMLGLI